MNTPEVIEQGVRNRLEALRIEHGATKQAAYNAAGLSRNSYELKMANGSFKLIEAIRLANFYGEPIDKLLATACNGGE